MGRVSPIGAVYAELRRTLGASATAKELLHFAAEFLRFFARSSDSGDEVEQSGTLTLGRGFEEWPVDLAMQDGGWLVLDYEMDQSWSELEVGRAYIEDTYVPIRRCYTAESERVFPRSLDWLLTDKRSEDKVGFGEGYDDYTSATLDGLDFE